MFGIDNIMAERLFSCHSCRGCIIIIYYLYIVYDSQNGEGGGESIRFTSRKSDVGCEKISRVTFSIGLAHESRPKNSLCRKLGRGSRVPNMAAAGLFENC